MMLTNNIINYNNYTNILLIRYDIIITNDIDRCHVGIGIRLYVVRTVSLGTHRSHQLVIRKTLTHNYLQLLRYIIHEGYKCRKSLNS